MGLRQGGIWTRGARGRHEDTILGGAEALPAGFYRFDLKTALDGEPRVLEGVTFRAAGRDDPAVGRQIE